MHNLAAGLFGASVAEMTRIVTLMGGSAENVVWLPGVGDQYVTCAGGRTIRLALSVGAGLTYTEAVLEMAGLRRWRVRTSSSNWPSRCRSGRRAAARTAGIALLRCRVV